MIYFFLLMDRVFLFHCMPCGFFLVEHRTFESNTVITLEIKVSDPLPQGLLFSCIVFVDHFCFLECGSLSVCQDQPEV